MTPAERARQIDKEEFAAECAAIRQRAYARFNIKPQPEKRVRDWIARVEPKRSIVQPIQAKRAVKASRRVRVSQAKLYEAFGQKRTLKEWAVETGMSPNTIRNRLNIGWTIEDALTRKVQGHSIINHHTPIVNAATRAVLAREAGIDPRTVESRVRRGWTLERALAVEPVERRSTGMNRAKLEKAAARLGVTPQTVWSRMNRGWSLERALSEPCGPQKGKHRHEPGVVADFAPSEGTGAGSTAQETPNLTFSGNDA